MRKLSYNILGQYVADQPRLLERLAKQQPAWTLVLDNLDLARAIKARVPACNVIFRTWPDDGLHTTREAEAWVLEKKAQMQGLDAFAYGGNEPGWSAYALRQTASALKVSAQRVQAFSLPSPLMFIQEFIFWLVMRLFVRVQSQTVKSSVQWAIDVILAAKKHGLKVVVLNLSAGTPEAADWKTDKAQQLLRLLGTNRNMAVLGLHEYACGVITSGMGGWPKDIRQQDWPVNVEGRDCYHLGRYRFMVRACEQAGIQVPRVVITEFGFDDMSDIKPWAEMLIKTPPHQTIRGWRTLVNQWRDWWPSWSAERALYEQYNYAPRTFYSHPAVEALLAFQYGAKSADWGPFDMENADEFHSLLESEETPVTVPTANTYQLVTLKNASYLNLRKDHNTASEDIGDVKPNDVLYIYPDIPPAANGYFWVKVDQWRNNIKLVTGAWFAVTHPSVLLTQTTAPTPPEPPEPEDDAKIKQAEADMRALIEQTALAFNTMCQAFVDELSRAAIELNRIKTTLE